MLQLSKLIVSNCEALGILEQIRPEFKEFNSNALIMQ